ncbi:MAG: RimK family alpha-L-glutamate ligase, partial [Kiloniellaceae bacterium]
MARIHVLHENSAWVEPLRAAFTARGLPYEEWFLDQGQVPFDTAPPEGVFYNRMSASSHTRGHRFGPELAHGTLNWLEAYGRRVVNGTRALYLEVSKLAQYAALNRAGVATPRTVAAVGREHVLEAARAFGAGPYILKPNRGGKGLGVQLFQSVEAIAAYLDGPGHDDEAPIDGVWLIQEYVRAPAPFITRCEFVGGRFLYAVRVDTSDGFELCPADACNVADAFCPAEAPAPSKFTILPDFAHPILRGYGRFLRENEIEIAGIEFIASPSGDLLTYDVNTN